MESDDMLAILFTDTRHKTALNGLTFVMSCLSIIGLFVVSCCCHNNLRISFAFVHWRSIGKGCEKLWHVNYAVLTSSLNFLMLSPFFPMILPTSLPCMMSLMVSVTEGLPFPSKTTLFSDASEFIEWRSSISWVVSRERVVDSLVKPGGYGQITNPVDVRLLRGNRCEGKVIYDLDGVFSSFKKQEPSWEECRVCGSQTVVNSGSRWEEAFEEEKWEWVYAERILFEKTKGRDKRMQREKNMTMMLPAETRRRRNT